MNWQGSDLFLLLIFLYSNAISLAEAQSYDAKECRYYDCGRLDLTCGDDRIFVESIALSTTLWTQNEAPPSMFANVLSLCEDKGHCSLRVTDWPQAIRKVSIRYQCIENQTFVELAPELDVSLPDELNLVYNLSNATGAPELSTDCVVSTAGPAAAFLGNLVLCHTCKFVIGANNETFTWSDSQSWYRGNLVTYFEVNSENLSEMTFTFIGSPTWVWIRFQADSEEIRVVCKERPGRQTVRPAGTVTEGKTTPTMTPQESPAGSPGNSEGERTGLYVGVVVGVLAACGIVAAIVLIRKYGGKTLTKRQEERFAGAENLTYGRSFELDRQQEPNLVTQPVSRNHSDPVYDNSRDLPNAHPVPVAIGDDYDRVEFGNKRECSVTRPGYGTLHSGSDSSADQNYSHVLREQTTFDKNIYSNVNSFPG